MKKTIKQTAWIFAVCVFLLQTGCKNPVEKRPLLWYTEYSFPFAMTLYSPDGTVSYVLSGEKNADGISVTAVSPEGIRGLNIRYEGGNCTLKAGETVIPLSREAAGGLTRLLDALLVTSPDGAKLGSDAEGRTTAAYEDFTLTFDGNGLPCGIAAGRQAEITVRLSDITDINHKDQQK